MYTGDFHSNLKRLNPFIKVDPNTVNHLGERIAGLYVGDLHVCSVPFPIVPENDVREEGVLKVQGMRTILKMLVRRGVVDQIKAERRFRLSLGMNRIDKNELNEYREHIEQYKKRAFWERHDSKEPLSYQP